MSRRGELDITLASLPATAEDIWLSPVLGIPYDADIFCYAGEATAEDVRLYPVFIATGTVGPGFPTQYAGLRVQGVAMVELCLVAESDAPSGMGGVLKLMDALGNKRAVYLVETSDANASPVRIRTTTGTKAIRLKT